MFVILLVLPPELARARAIAFEEWVPPTFRLLGFPKVVALVPCMLMLPLIELLWLAIPFPKLLSKLPERSPPETAFWPGFLIVDMVPP